MSEQLVKFNAEVCAMIVTTAAGKSGLPAEALAPQIQQLSANLYAMGFMLCGNPQMPNVHAVCNHFRVPIQQIVNRAVPAPVPAPQQQQQQVMQVQAPPPPQMVPQPAAPAQNQPPLLDPIPGAPSWPNNGVATDSPQM